MTEYELELGSVSKADGLGCGLRQLHVGDNVEVMRGMEDEMVDLVYLDPPFNSNRNYKIVFRGSEGLKSEAHLPAFEDVWIWDDVSEMLLGATIREYRGEPIADTVAGMFQGGWS